MLRSILPHIIVFTFFVVLYKFFPGGFEDSFKRGDGSRRKATWMDCIYFATATHTTTGFGDVVPDNDAARTAVTMHMLIVFAIVVLGIKL
jgi:hypothetical protein|nr:potassium channel protein kcv [Acanthocystis turfacea Chlorella virus GNLD22]